MYIYICTIYLVHKKIYLSLITNYRLPFRGMEKKKTYTKIISRYRDYFNNVDSEMWENFERRILRKSKEKYQRNITGRKRSALTDII